MVQRRAAEWYNGEDGLEDTSQMDTNQSGDVCHKDTVCPKRLEDWKNTILSEDVQADWLSEQSDWRMKGL
jgi:hypothetical protein